MSSLNLFNLLESEMRRNATVTVMYHQNIAEKLGLNPTDHKCLDMILNNEPVTAGKIKDFTGLTTGAVTGVIDRLEKANFVYREHDPHDRRRIFIRVNREKASQAIAPLFEPLGEGIKNMLSSYDEKELNFLLDFYKRINSVVEKEISKIKQG